jgi:hypothetical protein
MAKPKTRRPPPKLAGGFLPPPTVTDADSSVLSFWVWADAAQVRENSSSFEDITDDPIPDLRNRRGLELRLDISLKGLLDFTDDFADRKVQALSRIVQGDQLIADSLRILPTGPTAEALLHLIQNARPWKP